MVVGAARIDVRLFDVHSLKQKRSQVKRILNRMRSHFPLSVAEVGFQDIHQRSLIGASVCCECEKIARSIFKALEEDLEACGLMEIINIDFEYLYYGEDLG